MGRPFLTACRIGQAPLLHPESSQRMVLCLGIQGRTGRPTGARRVGDRGWEAAEHDG